LTSRSTTVLVSGCICKATAFDVLHARATAAGWDLAELMGETGCGAQCGLCRPYLREMLRSGQTEFYELLPPDSPSTSSGQALPRAERGDV
jgi:bacterioferritin-associated ferredoxin